MSLRHSIQTYNTKELLKKKTRNSIKNLSIPSKEPNISFEEPHVPLKEPQSPSKTLHISSKKSKHEPYIPSKETYIPFKREINSKKIALALSKFLQNSSTFPGIIPTFYSKPLFPEINQTCIGS